MVLAKQYVVGDDEGWNGNVDYQAWADDKTFKLGDVLSTRAFSLLSIHRFNCFEDVCLIYTSITY